MEKDYESIKSKLKKLLALAEGGVGGEAHNARILLEKLCDEYGISLEELLDTEKKSWYRFEIGARKIFKSLFVQCYCYVTGKHSVEYRRRDKATIAVELTAYEFAELRSMFFWHKENFKRDIDNIMETLFISYCSKYNLHSQTKDEGEGECKSLTPEEFAKIRAALAMQDCLNKASYHKQIEGK